MQTILVVEDEADVREIATRIMERRGYHVLAAVDGVDAIRILEASPRRIDLLVSDIVMPGMGGRDLAERAEQLQPGIRILFMSGYTDDVVLRHRLRDRRVPFLQKPFSIQAFAAMAEAVLRDEPPEVSDSLPEFAE